MNHRCQEFEEHGKNKPKLAVDESWTPTSKIPFDKLHLLELREVRPYVLQPVLWYECTNEE